MKGNTVLHVNTSCLIWTRFLSSYKLAIHHSRNKFFGEKMRFSETNPWTMNSLLQTICLFVICSDENCLMCRPQSRFFLSTNIPFWVSSKSRLTGETATKNRFAKTMNNVLHTICVSLTFRRCFFFIHK